MKKDLRKQAEILVGQPYTVDMSRDETTDGKFVYLATHPELPGCMAQGITIEEAKVNLKEVAAEYILSLLEDKLSVPEPQVKTSGTFSYTSNIRIYNVQEHAEIHDFLNVLTTVTKPRNRQKVGSVDLVGSYPVHYS